MTTTTRLTDEQLQAIQEGCDGVPLADIRNVVDIADRNEFAPQISRVKAWLSTEPTMAVRAMATELQERRKEVADLVDAIQHAASMISDHLEEFHDFEYEPHDIPLEVQQLRDIDHHLQGSLIGPDGTALRALAPPAPAVTLTQEQMARTIYDAFPFEPRLGEPHKPAWVEGGNSFMQIEARRAAAAILAAQRGAAVTRPQCGTPIPTAGEQS